MTSDAQLPTPDPAGAADEAGAVADTGDRRLLGLIDRMAGILDRSDLSELEVQVGATALVLRKPAAAAALLRGSAVGSGAGATVADPGLADAAGAGGAAGAASPGTSGAPTRPSVKAPLTGIWYGSPSPGTAAYVTAGGEVAIGQVIGLIEAMKLFNEIKSDLAGRVVRVHAEDGKLVRAKQPLIEVDPL